MNELEQPLADEDANTIAWRLVYGTEPLGTELPIIGGLERAHTGQPFLPPDGELLDEIRDTVLEEDASDAHDVDDSRNRPALLHECLGVQHRGVRPPLLTTSVRARRTHRFNTHHDLAAEEKNLAEIRQDLDVDDIRKAQLSTWSASYIVVLALEFCPAPIEGVVDPRRELYTQLLVERAEEAEHLDDLEGGLPVEVDSVELFDQPVNERLDATRVLVVEYMLQKLLVLGLLLERP